MLQSLTFMIETSDKLDDPRLILPIKVQIQVVHFKIILFIQELNPST